MFDAETWAEEVCPTVAESAHGLVNTGRDGAETMIVNVALPVPAALVALMGTVYVPACVGVPLMELEPAARLSPGGRLPTA